VFFWSYFSSKGEHNGTGLGLYTCQMLTELQLKGYLMVENQLDGAYFKLYLPQLTPFGSASVKSSNQIIHNLD
jgi:signal transduction histidine kinase